MKFSLAQPFLLLKLQGNPRPLIELLVIFLTRLRKLKRLINASKYDTDLTIYIPGMLELVFQRITENINTKE